MSFEILEAKKKFQKKVFSQDIDYFGRWIQRDNKKIASVFLVGRTRVRFCLLTNITKSVIF